MKASHLRARITDPALWACSDLTFRTAAGVVLEFAGLELIPAPRDAEGRLAGAPSAVLVLKPAVGVTGGEDTGEAEAVNQRPGGDGA